MTDGESMSITQRLLAALVVRERSMDEAVVLLRDLGVPLPEIAMVVRGLSLPEGSSQKQVVERMADLGFETAEIATITGYSKSSVGSVVSRHRSTKLPRNAAVPSSGKRPATKAVSVVPAMPPRGRSLAHVRNVR